MGSIDEMRAKANDEDPTGTTMPRFRKEKKLNLFENGGVSSVGVPSKRGTEESESHLVSGFSLSIPKNNKKPKSKTLIQSYNVYRSYQ